MRTRAQGVVTVNLAEFLPTGGCRWVPPRVPRSRNSAAYFAWRRAARSSYLTRGVKVDFGVNHKHKTMAKEGT